MVFRQGSLHAWPTGRNSSPPCPIIEHHDFDIRDRPPWKICSASWAGTSRLIIHTAAQPSHDWAAREPHADFSVNAVGTLNLLEAARQFCPEAVFIFTSTNKVYGDTPNRLPLVELEKRWEIKSGHRIRAGHFRDDEH